MDDHARLARRLRRFAEIEAVTSPLYRELAGLAAERPSLLDLLRRRAAAQPPANVLLASIQRRLMDRPDAALRAYYPSLGGDRAPDAQLAVAFDAFWRQELDALDALIRSARVATNEVARSAVLRLAYVHLAKLLEAQGLEPRVHLVEIGASAGLNLLWDRLGYAYGPHRLGTDPAPLVLATDWRAATPPDEHPPIAMASRLGIDLHVPDLARAEDVAWLRALIWPEHEARAARFDAAVALARAAPPPTLEADALAYLPDGLDALAGDLPAVVVHAFTLNQFSDQMRLQVEASLATAAATRPVFRVGFEWTPEGAMLTLQTYPRGASRTLALADPHGAWIGPSD